MAIHLNPQYAWAYCNRGSAYGKLGWYERAIGDFDVAIRLDHKFAAAHAERALAYAYLIKNEEAQRDFDRAVELGFDHEELERAIEEARQEG
jgi:tetratricopeptide (TPR) repeat protein